jgi:UDP-galactopyranose mutase
MKKKYDYLLVGAGLFNAVFAQQAKMHGRRCLVIDKRPHLGGNVYCENIDGITVHKYGPHIFHTSNKEVWDYVNSFVSFNRFTLNTLAYYKGRIFNLPFNMNTFHQMWGVVRPEEAKEKILQRRDRGKSHTAPSNLEEQAIALVGKDIYETLIKGYTEKQWGRPCSELPAFIIKRIPVRFTYDNNYYNDCYQGIPEGGYNKLIDALLNGMECKTNCDYFNDRDYFNSLSEIIVYSGAIDEYFDHRLGHLAYRSLRFEQETINNSNYQGNAIVNYTDIDTPFTRIVEHKHFDINNLSVLNLQSTVITREFPVTWSSTSDSEPYYPINDDANSKLSESYKELAKAEKNVIFGGRLAEYKYLDMHQVIERALSYW